MSIRSFQPHATGMRPINYYFIDFVLSELYKTFRERSYPSCYLEHFPPLNEHKHQ